MILISCGAYLAVLFGKKTNLKFYCLEKVFFGSDNIKFLSSDLATAAVNDSLTNDIDEIKNQTVTETDSSLSSGAISGKYLIL